MKQGQTTVFSLFILNRGLTPIALFKLPARPVTGDVENLPERKDYRFSGEVAYQDGVSDLYIPCKVAPDVEAEPITPQLPKLN